MKFFIFLSSLFIYFILWMYILTRIPLAEKDMAPIAQPLSGFKNSSGISRQNECVSSGKVPWEQGTHCV